jgi:signal transduction histidine kinase
MVVLLVAHDADISIFAFLYNIKVSQLRAVRAVSRERKSAGSGSTVACECSIAPDLWSCDFDETQIGQVIDTIVINAKQAMPGRGSSVFRTVSACPIDATS